jgi:serine protease Do
MKTKLLAVFFFFILILGVLGSFWYTAVLGQREEKDINAKILALQKQISGLGNILESSSTTTLASSAVLPQQELNNRQAVSSQSDQQQLTSAVARVTPSVVSIIISQDVPQYQVVYVNPFGDDPFFQDSGIQVPEYEPTGSSTSQEVAAGTGFIISSDGYILTNKHVVSISPATYTVLLSNGQQKQAQVVFKDPDNDLAIIKIPGSNYTPVTLGDSSGLVLGQTVFAVGNALGQYNNSVSVGVVSGLNRSISASGSEMGSEQLSGVIQTDAAINPGNSGGPLADLNGDVVGVNVATVQGSNNISFSIPINLVKPTIQFVLGKQ